MPTPRRPKVVLRGCLRHCRAGLVKEMRIHGISSIEEANTFLGGYLPLYNKRFAVKPAELKDLHRDIPKGLNLDGILCIRTERRLREER